VIAYILGLSLMASQPLSELEASAEDAFASGEVLLDSDPRRALEYFLKAADVYSRIGRRSPLGLAPAMHSYEQAAVAARRTAKGLLNEVLKSAPAGRISEMLEYKNQKSPCFEIDDVLSDFARCTGERECEYNVIARVQFKLHQCESWVLSRQYDSTPKPGALIEAPPPPRCSALSPRCSGRSPTHDLPKISPSAEPPPNWRRRNRVDQTMAITGLLWGGALLVTGAVILGTANDRRGRDYELLQALVPFYDVAERPSALCQAPYSGLAIREICHGRERRNIIGTIGASVGAVLVVLGSIRAARNHYSRRDLGRDSLRGRLRPDVRFDKHSLMLTFEGRM